MNLSRFVVGLVLIGIAVALLPFGGGGYTTAGTVGFLLLGLVSIVTSRKKPPA